MSQQIATKLRNARTEIKGLENRMALLERENETLKFLLIDVTAMLLRINSATGLSPEGLRPLMNKVEAALAKPLDTPVQGANLAGSE